MKLFEVAYVGNQGTLVLKIFKAKNIDQAKNKAEAYCDNHIIRITEVD